MNDLITRGEQVQFADDVIKKRGFIRAKYWSWEEPRNGLVTFANKDYLRVLFLTGTNIAASYYMIKIAEVDAKSWEITYTPDLATFYYVGKDTPAEDDGNGNVEEDNENGSIEE